jgi:hypothetical protein
MVVEIDRYDIINHSRDSLLKRPKQIAPITHDLGRSVDRFDLCIVLVYNM